MTQRATNVFRMLWRTLLRAPSWELYERSRRDRTTLEKRPVSRPSADGRKTHTRLLAVSPGPASSTQVVSYLLKTLGTVAINIDCNYRLIMNYFIDVKIFL